MDNERLLKMPEVAAKLGLSRTAIYRLIDRGELRPVHIGGALRFPSSTLNEWIENLKGEVETHAKAA